MNAVALIFSFLLGGLTVITLELLALDRFLNDLREFLGMPFG